MAAGIAQGQDPASLGALVNWVLLRSYPPVPRPAEAFAHPEEGIPYALSLALGMAALCRRSLM